MSESTGPADPTTQYPPPAPAPAAQPPAPEGSAQKREDEQVQGRDQNKDQDKDREKDNKPKREEPYRDRLAKEGYSTYSGAPYGDNPVRLPEREKDEEAGAK